MPREAEIKKRLDYIEQATAQGRQLTPAQRSWYDAYRNRPERPTGKERAVAGLTGKAASYGLGQYTPVGSVPGASGAAGGVISGLMTGQDPDKMALGAGKSLAMGQVASRVAPALGQAAPVVGPVMGGISAAMRGEDASKGMGKALPGTYGAAIGTAVMPVIGTVIGGAIGSLIGAVGFGKKGDPYGLKGREVGTRLEERGDLAPGETRGYTEVVGKDPRTGKNIYRSAGGGSGRRREYEEGTLDQYTGERTGKMRGE
ncbi:MAG: hypothetical protein KAS93_08140 [Gammaproteobacteria bacterium]|nr:hypothetical protein [Gammaproteobacteria bacterium]